MQATPPSGSPAQGDEPRSAETRGRRTDEIELIISGLTTVALFTLPGWLFDRFGDAHSHLSLALNVSAFSALTMLTGLCYAMGACFLVHLVARGYWVGLVGLQSVFPNGINWERTPGIGPLTREDYRRRLPDLGVAINRSDRFASSLFAVISMLALVLLWIGLLLTLTAVSAGVIGAMLGAPNRSIGIAVFTMLGIGAGVPSLLWLLDAVVGPRWPSLQRSASFRRVVAVLIRASSWLFPQRLVLPVQLTLQSNTRPFLFIALIIVIVMAAVVVGNRAMLRGSNFTLSEEFRYLRGSQIQHSGFRSAFYIDLHEPRDRFYTGPMLSAFEQSGAHLSVFLPYFPLRDNPVLAHLCPGEDADLGAGCLLRLWEVGFDGRNIGPEQFIVAQRGDLNMRGLIAIVPLQGARPGLQTLDVIWNPAGRDEDLVLDDRYDRTWSHYRVPFLFAPQFELELDGSSGEVELPWLPVAGAEEGVAEPITDGSEADPD